MVENYDEGIIYKRTYLDLSNEEVFHEFDRAPNLSICLISW